MGFIMRKYTLYDNDGRSYDVTVKGSAFLYGVGGLGYEDDATFQRINSRYKLLQKYRNQPKITGTVKFWQPNAEQTLFEFAQFCQNEPLFLKYSPQSGTTKKSSFDKAYVDKTTLYLPFESVKYENYYRRGYVTKIDKSDVLGNCLEVTIEFTAITPWYKVKSDYNYGGESVSGKKYNYEYPYVYTGSVSNQVTLISDSRQQSPTKITIMGPCTNPTWRHYVDGVLKESGKVIAEILPNHRLVIDTTVIPYSMIVYDAQNQEITDLYQSSDFETQRFVSLDYGENVITVSAEDVTVIGIGVEAEIEYATV